MNSTIVKPNLQSTNNSKAHRQPSGGEPTIRSSSVFPKLRDTKFGILHFVALGYALSTNLIGLFLLLQAASFATILTGILLSAHGRVVASYMVHEAAHASIFVTPWANRWCGVVALWLAGCPYADFMHVKRMHLSHHQDRADTVEFDYRMTVQRHVLLRYAVVAAEYCFVPMVETIMHLRTAIYPILWPHQVTSSRFRSAVIGTPCFVLFYVALWYARGWKLVVLQAISGAFVLQFLALNDAFHHTYEAILMKDYVPGPGPRTAAYEESNTYSNLISTKYPFVNLLSLNFGYHNAHHQKAIVPWYSLPTLHRKLYGDPGTDAPRAQPQTLPFTDILWAWYTHRITRVMQHDYGVVHPPDHPSRAIDFIGSLGVSFLTV